MTALAEQLTVVEATTLDDLEGVIEKGIATFIDVGLALARIRDKRLYRETHGTFEEYCKDRWGFSRRTGYDLMQTAEIANSVQEVAQVSREAARELAPLTDNPEQLQDAVRETVKAHGPKPTARQVREVVKRKKAPARAPRGPSKAQREERGTRHAERIKESLAYIIGCQHPSTVFGWALDALERDPDWNWEKFIEEIEAAGQALGALIVAAEPRAEARWPD
jgi:hypothetical protein